MAENFKGLVVRSQSRRFTVRGDDGTEVETQIPKRLRYANRDVVDPVAVGDRVEVRLGGEGGVIETILPRRNALARPASGRTGRRQILAANLDLAVIVLAAQDPLWKPATLDRYLVLASSGNVPAAACINKIDLDPSVRERPELEAYPAMGVSLVFTSAEKGTGIDDLVEVLAGKVAVFLGPSGAGKSSLINRLAPEAGFRVGEISERTRKGRHTTTWVEMHELPKGGRLVDSPGLRVLDLSLVTPQELPDHFPEMTDLDPCRFQDCRHMAEPDCSVKQAVANGAIAPHRYDSFVRILESLEAGEG